jgi:hypothetical protein
MLREATYPPAVVNVLDISSESMAAFQVFLYGRFWVFTEGVNPHRSPQGESASQDGPMAVRITDEGESECHSVMERISVALVTLTTSPAAKAGRLPFMVLHTRELD